MVSKKKKVWGGEFAVFVAHVHDHLFAIVVVRLFAHEFPFSTPLAVMHGFGDMLAFVRCGCVFLVFRGDILFAIVVCDFSTCTSHDVGTYHVHTIVVAMFHVVVAFFFEFSCALSKLCLFHVCLRFLLVGVCFVHE